jgi:hypothetical protein
VIKSGEMVCVMPINLSFCADNNACKRTAMVASSHSTAAEISPEAEDRFKRMAYAFVVHFTA